MNRVVVAFKPRFTDTPQQAEFDLTLSKKMTYDQIAQQVGEYLKYPSNKIRFTASTGQNQQPKTILRRHSSHTLAEMIQPGYTQTPSHLLYYELLDVTLTELETKKTVKVTWMGLNNKEEGQHSFLLAKTSSIHDAIDTLSKNVKLSPSTREGASGKIRMFEIPSGGRSQKLFQGNELIKEMTNAQLEDLFAEEVHTDELDGQGNTETRRTITCYHYTKDPMRSHGVPFRFVLRDVR